jgi:hypothetical protein
MTDPDIHTLVDDLHSHLGATEELDIDRRANRWIGEAEAVAEDVVGRDVSEQVVEKRVAQIEDLLRNIEETENQEADEHVDVALEIAERILERL